MFKPMDEPSAKLRNSEIQIKDFQFTGKGEKNGFQTKSLAAHLGLNVLCVPDPHGDGWL